MGSCDLDHGKGLISGWLAVLGVLTRSQECRNSFLGLFPRRHCSFSCVVKLVYRIRDELRILWRMTLNTQPKKLSLCKFLSSWQLKQNFETKCYWHYLLYSLNALIHVCTEVQLMAVQFIHITNPLHVKVHWRACFSPRTWTWLL